MRTSEEDVFAAGDCCVVKYNPAKTLDIYLLLLMQLEWVL